LDVKRELQRDQSIVSKEDFAGGDQKKKISEYIHIHKQEKEKRVNFNDDVQVYPRRRIERCCA
jgi:hypothetical protein